jgi:Right handed beta helix region/PA14 domain
MQPVTMLTKIPQFSASTWPCLRLLLRIAALLILALMAGNSAVASDFEIVQGMRIEQSGRAVKRIYAIQGADDVSGPAALTIAGDNITVDFAGATLQGSPAESEPDQRKGVGLLITGSNVTVKNLIVRGYKVGILGKGARALRLINVDCSYNWKQKLASTLESEDLSDWMSYHQNEKDEWLRYGAGIYLRNCDDFEVQKAKVRGGQCGLMLTACNRGLVWNSDFSFLSGIGVGLYLSSDNRIMHNHIDWCVRGYSHGVYNRGQDSAGILVYEQSSRNTFAYNSVTHGGDGFFLWAGQRTMDTGRGGCNDNLVYGCDFSHSPTNGIEATFSRNVFANCLIMECWHGVWGGYSFDSKILNCAFAYNGEAIAIEHGQENTIESCSFYRDATGVHLWQKPTEDPSWQYPKHRDTRSKDCLIQNCIFSDIASADASAIPGHAPAHGVAIKLKAASDVKINGCTFGPVSALLDARGPLQNLQIKGCAAILLAAPLWINDETLANRTVQEVGTGWTPDSEGLLFLPGSDRFPQPGTAHNSGAPALPVREGFSHYSERFASNWDPLENPVSEQITIGKTPGGRLPAVAGMAAIDIIPTPLAGGINPYLHGSQRRGRAYILVDQWGPYDWQFPVLWPRQVLKDQSILTGQHEKEGDLFEVQGPAGFWKLKHAEGAVLSSVTGRVPGWVRVKRSGQAAMRIVLEYTGGKTIDYRGMVQPAGTPIPFEYADTRVPMAWHTRFYRYNPATEEPRTMPDGFAALLKQRPVAEISVNGPVLNLVPGSIPAEVTNEHFASICDTDFECAPGTYSLDVTMDDGARVYLDGKLIIDEWHYQAPTLYTRELKLQGKHHLRIEHFQIDGYWTLKTTLRKKSGQHTVTVLDN